MSQTPRILKRKISLLNSELKMLQSYKTDVSLLYEEYKSEFCRDMAYIESLESQVKPPPESPSIHKGDSLRLDPDPNSRWRKTETGWEREEASSNEAGESFKEEQKEVPPWAKTLYKKIALASHPDRTLEEHELKKKKLNKIFADAAQAVSEGTFNKLLGYALELNIEVDDDPASIPLLEERVRELKKEIEVIQGSLEWLWGEHLGIHEVRARIAVGYLSAKNLLLKNADLVSIIKEMESRNESRPDN
jgi:hypothetical protein